MMYTDMVYYVLIIVRLCGSVKEKRELRVKTEKIILNAKGSESLPTHYFFT